MEEVLTHNQGSVVEKYCWHTMKIVFFSFSGLPKQHVKMMQQKKQNKVNLA